MLIEDLPCYIIFKDLFAHFRLYKSNWCGVFIHSETGSGTARRVVCGRKFFYCIVLNKVKYRRLNKIFINENSLDCSAVLDLFCFGPRFFFKSSIFNFF